MNGSKLRDENSPAKEESSFKSLPNDKILDSTKLKAFADDRMNFTQFLAHLSTTCSRGAFRITWYPSSVVCRASSTISLNISSQTTRPIWTKLGKNVPWVTLFKNCSRNFDLSINMALVNGGFLHYTDMKKFLKYILLRNRWSYFEIISQKCSLSDLSHKFLGQFRSVIKYGSGEWGLLSLYAMNIFFPKKSSSLKPLVRQ